MDFKIQRCMEYATENENLTNKALIKKIKEVDKNRSRTRDLVTSIPWGDKNSYHVTLNTTNWNLEHLAQVAADFALRWFEDKGL